MKISKSFKIFIIIIGISIISLFLPIIPTWGRQTYDFYGCDHLIFKTSKDILISNKNSNNVIDVNSIKSKSCTGSDPKPYNF